MTLTAIVTDVPFGAFGTIQGLMDTEGNYYIATTQLVSAELVPPNRSQKQLEALYSLRLPSHVKLKTPLNSKSVNAISIADFELLLAKLDRQGNKAAQILRDSLVGLSLHQLFSDAFGIELTTQDRQLKLTQLLHHNKNFHPVFTSWLKLDGLESGVRYGNAVNRLKVAAKCPLVPITEYDGQQMLNLNIAEARYDMARKLDKTHQEALQMI